MEDVYLICYLRLARRKTRQVAVMEALCLLSDLKVAAPNGGPRSRRGLPVPDARILVNLVATARVGLFLDPFGGIGGIVLEALAAERQVVSCDNDPVLRHGLAQLGARHCVADARNLPFRTASIAAIATAPPYDQQAANVVGRRPVRSAPRLGCRGSPLDALCGLAGRPVARDCRRVAAHPLS